MNTYQRIEHLRGNKRLTNYQEIKKAVVELSELRFDIPTENKHHDKVKLKQILLFEKW